MESYHYAWLSTHQERDELWLADRLKDGFAIHHRDGNSRNDDPTNLVLIEGTDHFRLHGVPLHPAPRPRGSRIARKPSKALLALGKLIYEIAATSRKSWKDIGRKFHTHPATVRHAAETYAKHNDLTWPLPRHAKPQKKRKKDPYRDAPRNRRESFWHTSLPTST